MKYFRVEVGNGYCGCDEMWVTETEADDLNFWDDVLEQYSYQSGFAGMDEDEFDEDEFGQTYEDRISENAFWEEISYDEFIRLQDEEGWEQR